MNLAVEPRGSEPRTLSIGQERLWFLDQVTPGSAVYHVPYASNLRGNLDVDALECAINAVIERHEVLRTAILPVRGTPRAVLLKKWTPRFEVRDFRASGVEQKAAQIQDFVAHFITAPFDWVRDTLLRAAVIRTADDEYLFIHVGPHLAFEGSSVDVLYHDLANFYTGSPLSPLPVQYADFAFWQRRTLTGAWLEELTRYWKANLASSATLRLPCDFPRPPVFSTMGRRHFFSIDPSVLSRAHSTFLHAGTSRYCGLLAVFYVLLYCYTGTTDLCAGSPFRPRCTGIEELIGFFVNTVVIRSRLARSATFRQILSEVHGSVQNAIAHCDLTFDKVVDALQPERDPSHNPLFQVNFRAPKRPYPKLLLPGVEAERAQYLDNGTAKFDLGLEIDSSLGEACYFEYPENLFNEQTILEIIDDYRDLLEALIESPKKELENIPKVAEIIKRKQG